MSVAKAVLLKSLLRRGTCTNRISIKPFLATSGVYFVLPPCEHLHTVIVLLSSRLGECLQDTVLTPHPLSGDVFACCFSPALCYPTSTLIGTLSHPNAPLKLVILNFI